MRCDEAGAGQDAAPFGRIPAVGRMLGDELA